MAERGEQGGPGPGPSQALPPDVCVLCVLARLEAGEWQAAATHVGRMLREPATGFTPLMMQVGDEA